MSAQSGLLLHDVPLPRILLLSSAPGLAGPAEPEERSRGSGRGDRGFPGDAAPPPRTPSTNPRTEARCGASFCGADPRAWIHAPSRRVQREELPTSGLAAGGKIGRGWGGGLEGLGPGTPRRPRRSRIPATVLFFLLVPRIPPSPAPRREDFNENGHNQKECRATPSGFASSRLFIRKWVHARL